MGEAAQVCLCAVFLDGEMAVYYSEEVEEQRLSYNSDEYEINPYFLESELLQKDRITRKDLMSIPEKSVIKLRMNQIRTMSDFSGLKIIYMKRNFQSILNSYKKSFSNDDGRLKMMQSVETMILKRLVNKKASFIEIDYDDVLKKPKKELSKIKKFGFDIDINKVIGIIDPSKKRF